jgi:threonine synthase
VPQSDVNTNAFKTYLIDAPKTMQRNPQLTGFACLRCGAHYQLALVHTGCIRCASLGLHISLRANYRKQPSVSHYTPYTTAVSLGEGNTPLTAPHALAQTVGLENLHIKDESHNPTGSHKDRMSAIGITQALDFGAHTVVLASSGNAAVSAAHYAHASGLSCEVATFKGMPTAYAKQLDNYGAKRFIFADNDSRWAFVAQRALQPGYFALTITICPRWAVRRWPLRAIRLLHTNATPATACPSTSWCPPQGAT